MLATPKCVMETLLKLIMCHSVGDYLFQSDYIAKNKGCNWYILFAHCALYCVPFAIVFGATWKILVLLVSHFLIDMAKARYKKIDIVLDQCLHYIVILFLFGMNL